MVVQSWQHRTGLRIKHLLGVQWVEAVGDFEDALVDPDVGDVPIRQPAAANQHVASLASTNSRTRRLSAPSSDARRAGSGTFGGSSIFRAALAGGSMA